MGLICTGIDWSSKIVSMVTLHRTSESMICIYDLHFKVRQYCGFLKRPLPVARCELRVDRKMPVDDTETPVDDPKTPVDIKMPVASKKCLHDFTR